MTTKFRARGEEELPNLEWRATKDDAFLHAVNRLSDEAIHGQHPQKIIIEELREAKLRDFFVFDHLVSAMRERMQELIGNDDAFTDENIARMRAIDNGYIAEVIDDIEANSEIRIDGYIVVNRWVVDRWWVKDSGDP